MTPAITTKSSLRYPGGKSRAVKIILDMIPENIDTVYSPFIGGGSVELALTQRGTRVNAYDGLKPLTMFWDVLATRPGDLAASLYPQVGNITKEIFLKYQQSLKQELDHDPLVVASKFFIVNRCSFSGATLNGGFSAASAQSRFTKSSVDRIHDFHNPLLSVGLSLWEESMQMDTSEFMFLDPPYLLPSGKNNLYGIGGDLHKSFDHEGFRRSVGERCTPFLLTYNDCDEIRDLWGGYDITPAQWSYGMNKSKKSSEIIIRNY